MKKLQRLFNSILPIYIPLPKGLQLAVWNCGFRPQSFIDALIDTRITIRKDGVCLFVFKKGEYSKLGKKRTADRLKARQRT